jgi:RimJ/RimL family protein N-acetyltransferase
MVRVHDQPQVTLLEPLPVLDGVALRRWRPEDAPAIAEACSDPSIAQWIPVPRPYPVDEASRYVDLTARWWQSGEQFVLCVARQDEAIGSISLRLDRDRPSIGYWLASSARGRGIMTAVVERLVAWAYEALDLEEVWIFVQPANLASRRVAERAGFNEVDERVTWPDGKERMIYRRSLQAVLG